MKVKGFYGLISWGHMLAGFLIVRHHRTFKTLTGFVTLPVTEATSRTFSYQIFCQKHTMDQGDAGGTGSGATGMGNWKLRAEQSRFCKPNNVCEPILWERISSTEICRAYGLAFSSLIWNLLSQSASCSSTFMLRTAFHPHSQQEDNGDAPTGRGTSPPVLHSPHFGLDETEATVSPFYSRRKRRRGHWQTSRAYEGAGHEPTFQEHQVLPRRSPRRSWLDPKACLAQFSTLVLQFF